MSGDIIMAEKISYREALRSSMYQALEKHSEVIIMGQGVNDPTGIFGTTKGLSAQFGNNRIIDMPIMEEGMTGIGIGASLNGLYPIQTHIRADFLLVAMNQLVNVAAKYKYMYGGRFKIPMLIRAVIGRSWGQGPQHSQSLQSIFAHVPGLKVIMPASAQSVLDSYQYAVNHYRGPVLSLEHRLLYDLDFYRHEPQEMTDPFGARLVREGNAATLVALSDMVIEAQKAAHWISIQSKCEVEIIDIHGLSPVDHALIQKSLSKTGRLIVVDTGWVPFGLAAEVARGILEQNPGLLKQPAINLGMQFCPTPTSHVLEDLFYPDMSQIVDAVYRVTTGQQNHGHPVPSKDEVKSLRGSFKGPF